MFTNGVYIPVDIGSYGTYAWGINNLGQVVGFYADSNSRHGFLLTIPEPSTCFPVGVLLAIFLAATRFSVTPTKRIQS